VAPEQNNPSTRDNHDDHFPNDESVAFMGRVRENGLTSDQSDDRVYSRGAHERVQALPEIDIVQDAKRNRDYQNPAEKLLTASGSHARVLPACSSRG
jgi:hypothetical protein